MLFVSCRIHYITYKEVYTAVTSIILQSAPTFMPIAPTLDCGFEVSRHSPKTAETKQQQAKPAVAKCHDVVIPRL
jgi:hypothetical protein